MLNIISILYILNLYINIFLKCSYTHTHRGTPTRALNHYSQVIHCSIMILMVEKYFQLLTKEIIGSEI